MAIRQKTPALASGFTRGPVQIVRSSLPYQILLYLNQWYFGLFFLAELLLYIFKGQTLPFAPQILPIEIVLIFILLLLEFFRIFFGKKGNLTERISSMSASIFLSIPSLIGVLYIAFWQTYVLRIELILASIQTTFISLELIFAILSVITFARATPY
ncbi:TMEM216 [Acanthosepion pharaonis]|uniref:TMEM216 n=1 Tax=Acanthosepion pharaonis TaxID=158019 RepID=A0A812B6B8_ACAPH|nr:TMEM216 [Sepia pharaonis]